MSPEFGFALLLTLLWGPTALWLGARVIRGQRGRPAGSFNRDSEATQGPDRVPYAPEALASQGFWICSGCHSMNRPQAKRCYSCGHEINAEGRRAPEPATRVPEALPTTRELVPVMAEALAGAAGDVARTNVVLAPPPAGSRKPAVVTAEPQGRDPRRKPAVVTAEPQGRDPRRKPAVVTALAVLPADPVCPFLGFSDDPTTRCSFPDPRNRCHTPAQQGNDPAAFPLRLITGKAGIARTLEIGPEHQESLCLTAAHEQCARFPAVPVAAGRR